jgi:glycolate oxidase iron-sulfur subunit
LLEPALSRAVLARKVDRIRDAAPDLVVTGNPGCAMQIGAGLAAARSRIGVAHPVELLDHSYRAAGYYGPVTRHRLSFPYIVPHRPS